MAHLLKGTWHTLAMAHLLKGTWHTSTMAHLDAHDTTMAHLPSGRARHDHGTPPFRARTT